MELDLLSIAAHRDDSEITVGGTLIKAGDMGYKVGLVDLTEGEMGTRGDAATRETEAAAAAKLMGLAVRENLGIPDAGVETNDKQQINKVITVIRKYKPKVVIAPYWDTRHPDHGNTGLLVYRACYLSGLKKYDVEGEPHRPRKIIYSASYRETPVKPTFVVDITDQFAKKLEAIRCYESQFTDIKEGSEIFIPSNDFYEWINAHNRQAGFLIRKPYGEPFFTKETMEVEDVMKLMVKSI